MTEAERKAIAEALRKLSRNRTHELPTGTIKTGDDDVIRLTTVDDVQRWLEGWAVRFENGDNP